jgi:hypothetical protein
MSKDPIEEVYEKYKSFEHIFSNPEFAKECFENLMLCDLWQAIKSAREEKKNVEESN